MKKTNTLVVGQGIAGSLAAYMLYQRKIPFMVIDPACLNTSSLIAAGMFTPVSGKRKTIDPILLQQIPFAIKTYKAIEQLIGASFLHLNNIYHVFNSAAEQNELCVKLANADFAKYITLNPHPLPQLKQDWGAFEATHSGWVNCGLFINGFAQWLKQNDALIAEEFLYEDLQFSNEEMQYHGTRFNNIIFCEGYKAAGNPFFKTENIIPCKGDMLTIKYDQPAIDRAIKKDGLYFIPAGKNLFKAGSTYQWNNNSTQPVEENKKLIESKLYAMLKNKFTIIDHKAAIRPTTKNRAVIARQHPQYEGMFMLNGLGTKGVVQGPWWANRVVDLCIASGSV